jgi:hypothetical protein
MLGLGIARTKANVWSGDFPAAYLNSILMETINMRLSGKVSAILVEMKPEYARYLETDRGSIKEGSFG